MSKRTDKGMKTPALTHDDIVHLAGDLEDAVISAILQAGATYREVEEAVKWATGDAEALGKEGRQLGAAAKVVYDILVSDPVFLGIRRER
jgi:hypothetical protein